TLAENLDLIKTPDLVLGFKLRDPKPAEAQLKRLEKLLDGLAAQAPPLKGRGQRAPHPGGPFLTLAVGGPVGPRGPIPFKKFEEEPGQYDALVKKLTGLKATLSIGVRGDYLLIALGESTAPLARLDGKGKRLNDRPELKPLAPFAEKRLTSISYASQA